MGKRKEVEGLTKAFLQHLYEVELLTETEIGNRFGVGQVFINRRRKRWGIPTISKKERAGRSLPSLTEKQHELLLGSLLGDGWMSSSSDGAARFNENHGTKQVPYLLWKRELLGEYVSLVYDTVKRARGKEYEGKGFTTRTCPQLWPYYDLFYPAPERKRVFPKNLRDLMTPFVLAVWFMDDGSCSTFHPRITFGLDDLSLKRACDALRKLGLKPAIHENDRDKSVGIHFPGQSDQFFDLVREHIPECMGYKLPQESERREVDRNAKKLTPEAAREMYDGGMSLRRIARLYGVSTSTVSRRLHTDGKPKRMGRPRRKFSRRSAEVALQNIDVKGHAQLGPLEQIQQVMEVLKILRRIEFPFPPVMGEEESKEQFQTLCEKEVYLSEEKEIRPRTLAAIKLCYGHFPNRYKAAYKTQPSAFDLWHAEKGLRKAIEYQLRVGDPVTPRRVLRAVTMQARTPTVFRPGVAKYMYQTYAQEGLPVWDPCSGYGGRMLGALSVGLRYIATDVEPRTVEGNQNLAEVLGLQNQVRIVNCPAEEFDPGEELGMVFTSPPYFDRERYSERDQQSWKRYQNLDSWVDGFLRPVFQTAMRRLVKDGCLALNIADLKEKSGPAPLVQATIDCAVGEGFSYEDTIFMPLARLNRAEASEPVLVFRK